MKRTVGFTCSTFDLFHAGHVAMLEEAKTQCDWLIVGVQTDPSIDRPTKNKPVQNLIERQLQVRACKFVDETIVYATEADLLALLCMLPIDVRILGEEYEGKPFTGSHLKHMRYYFNKRSHGYSSSELRKRVANTENRNGSQEHES
jgi:glycerol-3-phosphate cytidylyltransferase